MKISFYASVFASGLHGGAVYLGDDAFYFCCQKAIIDNEYKNFKIPYENIKSICKGKRALFFPTTIIETKIGVHYRFLIFNRKKFIKYIKSFCKSINIKD